MSNKIYITADWHLAEGAWKPRSEIAGDAFESLRYLIGDFPSCEVSVNDTDLMKLLGTTPKE